MKTRTTRHCCVHNCPNPPAKGRKTCGCHGKRRATRSPQTIKADRVLRTWCDYETDTAAIGLAVVQHLPTEQPYLAGVAIRDNGAILGLPTTPAGLKRLLADWLLRPGRSLADIELLTPPHLPARDISTAICDTAARMVRYDLAVQHA